MTNQSKTHITAHKASKLDAFTLQFEYNVPWGEASKTVQHRPIKK